MKRIGIPEGMTISAVICIKKVDTIELNGTTELHVAGFTRNAFGDIMPLDILLATPDPSEVIRLLRELQEGAMFSFRDELFSFEGDRIFLRYPKLDRWDEEPFDLSFENEEEKDMTSNDASHDLELIARKIANRSKRQRHYFSDDDDVSPSRKVKGLWTYGRETYGLEKIHIYVPAQSEIPLRELAKLLSRIDGKLERAGSFKRILCTYGDPNDESKNGLGSFLKGHFKISSEQWLAALTMLTEQGEAARPISFSTFRVPYKHAFGEVITTRPRHADPIVIVAPHRDVTVSEKALKGMRALRKNVTWVFYDDDQGWEMDSSLSFLGKAREFPEDKQ